MSGSNIAYHLRMNKFIDRQLLREALELVSHYQSVAEALYVSMGGWTLEDFRVLHQAFGIRKMLSFDIDDWVVSRQQVNRPFGFVQCMASKSEEVIEHFDSIRMKTVGSDGNVIAWLDYTEENERYQQLSELQRLTGKLIHGDVFRITMNAHRKTLGTFEQHKLAIEEGNTECPTLAEWWQEKLAQQLNEYMPPERNDPEFIDSEFGLPVTLVRAIKRAALNGLTSRPELVVEPLLAVTYADGHRMITFTGVILEKDQRNAFRSNVRWKEWRYPPGEDWDSLVKLSVPALSLRERQIIHSKMKSISWPFAPHLLNFQLDQDPDEHVNLVEQYMTHYRRYPTFAPSDIL